MTTKSRFDYDKWIDHFQAAERFNSDGLAKGQVIFGTAAAVGLLRDIQTMLKELKSVSNVQ